ncbi:MAG: outer membrane protein assembly factor BamC [Sutterellaceae bacterium]|nr:outer membrane protein assembly factor BamC [Sutterellaceae bacterium]
MVNHAVRVAATALAVCSLAGCSSLGINLGDDKVQYESSTSRAPLEIPPDLNQIEHNDRYAVPTRPQIVSANAEAAKLQMQAEQRGEAPANVLPQTQMAKVVRDGSVRYVHVEAEPDKVWPLLQDFWAKVGLAVKYQDARTGVIQTEWAENKANLPKDIIRQTLGTILDVVYDTGTRDQYRARMERDDEGKTNIYITHRQMVEVLKGRQEESTVWQPGPTDPELEAVMLTRLAQALEEEFNPAAKPQEQRELDAMAAVKYAPMSELVNGADGKAEAVMINEQFDRAWRRVGVALDRSGFEVTDTDRSQGLFMVNYLDPDYEKEEISKQGFFSNLFSNTKAVDPVAYQIRLVPDGEKTRITVLGKDGRADETGVAPRILALIAEQTR